MSLRDRVIVFDFDGVIWDSVDEAFEQAWIAWGQLGRACPRFDKQEAQRLFREARWQCRDGHDFFIVMSLLTDGRQDVGGLPAEAFRAMRAHLDHNEEAVRFVELFYASRSRMLTEDFGRWSALQRPYPGVIQQLALLRDESRGIAVATTKDADSARKLLTRAGIHDVPIYGREVSLDKRDHMQAVSAHFGVPTPSLAFVEDLLENLLGVAELSVRLVLADWGYNTPAERSRAQAEGVAVVSLDTLYMRLRALWPD